MKKDDPYEIYASFFLFCCEFLLLLSAHSHFSAQFGAYVFVFYSSRVKDWEVCASPEKNGEYMAKVEVAVNFHVLLRVEDFFLDNFSKQKRIEKKFRKEFRIRAYAEGVM